MVSMKYLVLIDAEELTIHDFEQLKRFLLGVNS